MGGRMGPYDEDDRILGSILRSPYLCKPRKQSEKQCILYDQ